MANWEVLLDSASEFPKNRYNLQNDSSIQSNHDLSFARIKKGQAIKINWDWEYVRYWNLTWSVERICDEIDKWIWTVLEDTEASTHVGETRWQIDNILDN